VGNIVGQVGMTPQSWNSGIFTMIQNLSNTVILPIAGAILAIVMALELIQLVTDRNNLNDVDTWMFFKWVFKSACAVVIVTHTWDIVMGIFEASQSVVNSAAGVIVGQTSIDISSVVGGLESRLSEMDLGPLFGLWFQSLFVGLCTWAITICIFIITYGRMIEVFLVTSVAPIPMATICHMTVCLAPPGIPLQAGLLFRVGQLCLFLIGCLSGGPVLFHVLLEHPLLNAELVRINPALLSGNLMHRIRQPRGANGVCPAGKALGQQVAAVDLPGMGRMA